METDTIPPLPIAEGAEPSAPEPNIMERFQAFKETTAPKEDAPPPPAEQQQQPPADTTPEPAANEPEPTEPKAKLKWGELKAKATRVDELEKTLTAKEQELATFRQRNEELAKNDPTLYEKQIKEKEQAIADYEKRLAVYDVRESKAFREEVLTPMTKIATDVDRLAATYGISAADLKVALSIGDPKAQMEKITELTADFNDMHKAKVWGLVEKTQEIYDKAAQIEANAAEAKKEIEFLQSQEKEKSVAERRQTLQKSSEAVKQQMLEHLPMLKDEAVAKDVFAVDLETTDPTLTAYRAYASQALVHVVKDNRAKEKRIKELEGELAARASMAPKPNGNTQAHTSDQPAAPEGDSVYARARAYGVPMATSR